MTPRAAVLGLVCACGLLAPPQARAVPTTYEVRQSALNKFSSALGTLSGNAGRHAISAPVPCFPDFWNTCWVVLYNHYVYWRLSNPRFSVTTAGVRFSGNVQATYGAFSFATTVSGPVNVGFNSSTSTLQIGINSISVPITIQLPFIGSRTITTMNLNPNYNLAYPVGTPSLSVVSATGALRTIHVSPTNVVITPQNGTLRVQGEFVLW